ncbi:endogenous retrovirus group K member 7 Pro protein-like [Microtus oregoni]|uniref:endogenous retrovirus group K member 7 Pro protein-like n=1 Tax=Microtus oregoni TaxID=111838 RepID=UPI001BB17046|nr:endogenous retrovirus group K member 7 Pro protein-like [Microtus oregoni]
MGLDQRPIIALNIEGKTFQGLLDTGADRSIIREGDWPKRWPLQLSSQTLQGLGYANTPKVSAKELTWTYEEGQKGLFQPFVLDLPISLWGRDVLSQMRIKLVTQYSDVSQQLMLQSGYVPGKGLGKGLQGTPESIMPSMSPGRQGLGFS